MRVSNSRESPAATARLLALAHLEPRHRRHKLTHAQLARFQPVQRDPTAPEPEYAQPGQAPVPAQTSEAVQLLGAKL